MSKMVVEKYGETKAHYMNLGKDEPLFVIHALSPEEMRFISAALCDYKKKWEHNTEALEKYFGDKDNGLKPIVLQEQMNGLKQVTELVDSFTSQFSHYTEFSCGSDA